MVLLLAIVDRQGADRKRRTDGRMDETVLNMIPCLNKPDDDDDDDETMNGSMDRKKARKASESARIENIRRHFQYNLMIYLFKKLSYLV